VLLLLGVVVVVSDDEVVANLESTPTTQSFLMAWTI